MSVPARKNARLYTRYPLTSVFLYNGVTIAHYVLGGVGIILGYDSWFGTILGALYLIFAIVQMYVLMPIEVCPNCVYFRLENSLCISGLNVISQKLARDGDPKNFANRAKGGLCPNNLYIASLVIPIVAMIPALFINFSFVVLAIFVVVIGLLLFRFFYLFTHVACVHCRAKSVCPNAKSMGISSKS
jgi:hypothetical protein